MCYIKQVLLFGGKYYIFVRKCKSHITDGILAFRFLQTQGQWTQHRHHHRFDRCEHDEWKENGKLFWKLSPIIRELKKRHLGGQNLTFVVWHWHPKPVKGLRLDCPSPKNNRLVAIWSSFHVANFKTTAGPGGWSLPRASGFADCRNVINGKSHCWLFMFGVDAKHVVCQGVRAAGC